jgi:N-acetylmuramoyl-L-alanine amidase
MLFGVQSWACLIAAVVLATSTLSGNAAAPCPANWTSQPAEPSGQTPNQRPAQDQQPATSPLPLTPPQTSPVPAAPPYTGPVIVLDAAHGGTDTGARGENGAIEKDLVLDYARMIRSELESQGFRVVMTRNDDSDPSYADRAAVANAYRNALFISLHVSSTGTFGTVHTYYYKFGSAPSRPPVSSSAASRNGQPENTLVRWDEAQAPEVNASRGLADALQAQLAQRFNGSPAAATPAPVRQLRSVDAPAVAIEISSVSVQDPNRLAALAAPLAVGVARGLQGFRPATSAAPKAN